MSVMKVYIIGAVTGHDTELVRIKFKEAAEKIKSMGLVPINPIDYVPEGTHWNTAMRICIKQLVTCDAIFKLPDYESSKGAIFELMIARNLDMHEFNERILRSAI
jgi:hypothetical protein